MAFKKAKREQVWLKLLLTGPSGSGKSYSALRLATGLAQKCGSDIAYIGTEGSRDKYYANEFQYDLNQLSKDGNPRTYEDFSPESYIHNIEEAVNGGYKVIVIDSLSPEWTYINEVHDAMKGNSFQNWGRVKPRHAMLMEYIMTSPIHIVACARGKDAWVLEDNNGKQVPRKVGMGAQQDKDLVYQYTVSFTLNDQDKHTFECDKDNTHLFSGIFGKQLTEKDGEALYDWANDSDVPATVSEPKKFEAAQISDDEKLATAKQTIVSMAVQLGGTKNAALMAELKKVAPNGNPNAIKDLATAEAVIKALNSIQPIG